MYASIAKSDAHISLGTWVKQHGRGWMFWDVMIKVIGLILSATIYPPTMLYSVLVTLICIVIPNQIKRINHEEG